MHIPPDQPLPAGFNVSFRLQPSLTDAAGRPIDPQRMTSLNLKNSDGTSITLDRDQPQWLRVSRVARRSSRLESIPLLYAVESVTLDGANVAIGGPRRPYPKSPGVWQIELPLYSVRFKLRDALFGFPSRSAIRLEHPNGLVQDLAEGADPELQLLPRGYYRASVQDALGDLPPTSIALFRDQEVQLNVTSFLDIAVLGLLLATLILGILIASRPQFLLVLSFRLQR